MITKDNFIRFISAIKTQHERDVKFSDAMKEAFIDFQGWYNNEEVLSVIEEYLIDIFNDKGEWIPYFIYDLDFGKEWTKDCCSSDGKSIDISTVDKLYDFLIKNMED